MLAFLCFLRTRVPDVNVISLTNTSNNGAVCCRMYLHCINNTSTTTTTNNTLLTVQDEYDLKKQHHKTKSSFDVVAAQQCIVVELCNIHFCSSNNINNRVGFSLSVACNNMCKYTHFWLEFSSAVDMVVHNTQLLDHFELLLSNVIHICPACILW